MSHDFDIYLDEFESEETDTIGATVRAMFTITDDTQAEWAMRKLATINARHDELKAVAEMEISRVTMWLDRCTSRDRDDVEFFTGLLTSYAARVREAEGRKTLTLPHGSVKSRASAAKITVADPELFMKWAVESGNADLVKVTTAPSQSAINAALRPTDDGSVITDEGELVVGVNVVPASVKFTVETTK